MSKEPMNLTEPVRSALARHDAGYAFQVDSEDVAKLLAAYDRLTTPAQGVQVPCPVCGGEAIHALEVLKRTVIMAPLPWDAGSNHSYEPVEKLAAEIYDAYAYWGQGEKPAWVPGGNSTMQDDARFEARRELRKAGHTPSVSSTDREAGR